MEGLEVVAPYLVEWCSSYNEIETLDFSDFVSLETIECYYSRTLTNVNLNNTQNLKRACFEDCDLESLDLSQSPNLEDLRGARNRYTSINFGDTREHVWHICVRSNTQITESFPPMTEFPVLRDLYIWNTNQTGHLEVSSPVIQILASNNHYTSADFSEAHFNGSGSIVMDNNDLNTINISGCEGIARIHLKYNNLTSIDISGITTIYNIEMNSNNLTESAVEDILYNLDLSGIRDGNVNLSGETNSAPNENALIYASNLEGKGWTVALTEPAP